MPVRVPGVCGACSGSDRLSAATVYLGLNSAGDQAARLLAGLTRSRARVTRFGDGWTGHRAHRSDAFEQILRRGRRMVHTAARRSLCGASGAGTGRRRRDPRIHRAGGARGRHTLRECSTSLLRTFTNRVLPRCRSLRRNPVPRNDHARIRRTARTLDRAHSPCRRRSWSL